MRTFSKMHTWLLLTGFILLGAALRFHHINRVPLRGDEAFTVIHWLREPLSETFRSIATVDPQPPLAYIMFHLWGQLTGTGEYAVRFLPALVNVIGIAVLYALGKRFGGVRVGLCAAFLWAVHPYQIWHAQDARNYALWAVLSPLALWLGLRAIDRDRPVDWALYYAAAVAAAYMYYLELFALTIFAAYLVLRYRPQRRVVLRGLIVLVLVALTLAPWFLQARLLFGSGYTGTTFSAQPDKLLTWFVPSLMFGEVLQASLSWLWVAACAVLVVGMITVVRCLKGRGLLLCALGILPLVLITLVSLRLNVFTPRYILFVSAVYIVICAYLVTRNHLGALVGIALLGVMIIANVQYFYTDYRKAPDWRMLAAFLSENLDRQAQVIQLAADEAYTFYHEGYALPSDPLRLPANPRQSAAEISSSLATAAADHESLWIIADAPPAWTNRSVVTEWLHDRLQRTRSVNVGGLRAQEYRAWHVVGDHLPIVNFDDTVRLLNGWQVFQEPDRSLTVWAYWQPLRTTEQPLHVFLHLVGAVNPRTGTPLWAQDDQAPQDGRAATTLWEPGQILRDVYSISLADVPADQYNLVIGLYDPADGTRLPSPYGDSYTLGQIVID
ncbi:MAG: glycosyltransferase family 39 protein [bacterium]|nr:glycosyltransferase family 39 protein [bacterium]